MYVLPHSFPALRANGTAGFRPVLLTIGAGMSYGLVPGPEELCRQKRSKAEKQLGVLATQDPTNPNLYTWAEEIITALTNAGEPNPKLKLAQALDIPTDICWQGCGATMRNTARHRVLARFAREGIWEQVWSLNWDRYQESGFENVGLRHDGRDDEMPWPTSYKTFVTTADCAGLGTAHVIKVIKPHGCVSSLIKAAEKMRSGDVAAALDLANRFVLTQSELDGIAPKPGDTPNNFIFANLCTRLATHPWIIAGWKVSERYLTNYIRSEVRPLLDPQKPLPIDQLCIVDPFYNTEGHSYLAEDYGKTKAEAHIPVETTDLTVDNLFLWLQAMYALDCLRRVTPTGLLSTLDSLIGIVQHPVLPFPFIVSWVDDFLPTWVRLVWRCGNMNASNRTGAPIDLNSISLESRDEHVPWFIPNVSRPDLIAASVLLCALQSSGHAKSWDFERFPGGLFRATDNLLIIPVPAWNTDSLVDLRGLKPVFDAISAGAGYISDVAILPLASPGTVFTSNALAKLKQAIASQFPITRFAAPTSIATMSLTDL